MTSFAGLSENAQVHRLRGLAAAALTRFPLRVRRFSLLNHGENTTFRVEAAEGTYVLRIHRLGYHRPEQVDVELAWLDALTRETELEVPRPCPGKDGRFRQSVSTDGVPGPRACVLFAWLGGRFLWDGLRPVHARRVGALAAALHQHARENRVDPDGVRPRLDAEGLCGRTARFGAIEDVPGLEPEEMDVITAARAEIARRLGRRGDGPDVFGFIHADLHGGNMLFRGQSVRPIDFDDCAHGYWMYDLAVCIRFLMAFKERYPPLRDALLAGYDAVTPLDADDLADVSTLVVARRLSMLGWVASRSDIPRIASHLPGALRGTLEVSRRMLDGEPIID